MTCEEMCAGEIIVENMEGSFEGWMDGEIRYTGCECRFCGVTWR